MNIPEIILLKISNSHSLDAYVKNCVSKIENHISANKMVFFPEYTDHDVSHFEAVLETCVDLATDASLEKMSTIDFAILTVSVMLHDVGMHLTKDGFETLIQKNSSWRPIEGFKDVTWHDLWVEFIAEAKRFDALKLQALFGPNFEPVTGFPNFEQAWNEFDYLLVGEFLRRHHPRLAHEIALYGMPSINGEAVQFCSSETREDKFIADIGGLVARSHGMDLRSTFDYLRDNYDNIIEIRSSHPVFLMTLLRTSDYLQIQSSRAPTARTLTSKFRSPISNREWSVHQCVTDISNVADPEAIDIIASPPDVTTFLRLRDWTTDLQKELDMSWAVLGEVYGLQTHSGLNSLGLCIRRILSNIDDLQRFSKTVNYVPEKIAFNAAGGDLLKLLVGPLYSNDISVGLRELVQNAVDAVKEHTQLVAENVTEVQTNLRVEDGDVMVQFITDSENEQHVKQIIISDNGVGMTLDVIRDYFLTAGASFRSSDAWKAQHEKSDGALKIQRSGRFGVGALAAFLLGDRITVSTRHYSATEVSGYKFSAGIDTSAINIERESCPAGTRICIDIPQRLRMKVFNLLPNQWSRGIGFSNNISSYFGTNPKCVYLKNNDVILQDPECYLPSKADPNSGLWNFFETDSFEVNWCFNHQVPSLSVNQIRIIQNFERHSNKAIKLDCLVFETPKLSIGDNYGSFPLNLQRNEVAANKLLFERELITEITDEFLFKIVRQQLYSKGILFPKYNGMISARSRESKSHVWFYCSDGLLLNDPFFLAEYSPEFAYIRYGGRVGDHGMVGNASLVPPKSILSQESESIFSKRGFKMKGKITNTLQGETVTSLFRNSQLYQVFVPKMFVDSVIDNFNPGKDTKKTLNMLEPDLIPNWLVFNSRGFQNSRSLDGWRETLDLNTNQACMLGVHKLSKIKKPETGTNRSAMFERWMELIGSPVLPLDTEALEYIYESFKLKFGAKFEIFERRAIDQEEKERKRNNLD